MKRNIKIKDYTIAQREALKVSASAEIEIDAFLSKSNERYVLARVLLIKVCLEQGVCPYQVSFFLRKHPSTTAYYEKLYLGVKKQKKYQDIEHKYYSKYRNNKKR